MSRRHRRILKRGNKRPPLFYLSRAMLNILSGGPRWTNKKEARRQWKIKKRNEIAGKEKALYAQDGMMRFMGIPITHYTMGKPTLPSPAPENDIEVAASSG